MKNKILFSILTILTTGIISSCSQDEIIKESDNCVLIPMTFTAGISKTRTQLINENQVNWTSGDEISVIDDNTNKNYKFSTMNDGLIASFKGKAPEANAYYAVYPYMENAFYIPYYKTLSALSLSHIQQAVDGTFDTKLNISWATTKSDNMLFQFKNITSLLKFKLSGNMLSEIKSIKLTDNKGTGLAYEEFEWDIENEEIGSKIKSPSSSIQLTAPADGFKSNVSYYFTFIPNKTVFNDGLTLTFCNARGEIVMEKSTNHTINTASGVIYNLGTFEIKDEPENGYIDIDGTWEIYNEKGLQAWADRINNGESYINAKLIKDIDLTGIDWQPVGSLENPYLGIFDGNYKSISGLNINTEGKNVGFLAAIAKNSIVKNLTITNANVKSTLGSGNAGSLAGVCNGTIENVNLKNIEVTGYTIGGLVGGLSEGIIKGGTIDGNVSLNGYSKVQYSAMRAGGVTGYASGYGTIIKDVKSTADFKFTHQSSDGRIFSSIGLITGYLSTAYIYNCKVVLSNNVEVEAQNVGGIVGEAGQIGVIVGSSVETGKTTPVSFITSIQTDISHYIGGIAGPMGYSSSIKGCYSSGIWLKINGSSSVYKYVGGITSKMNDNCTISACYFNGQIIKSGNYFKLGAILASGPHVQYEECCWMSPTIGLNATGETSNHIYGIWEVTESNQWNGYISKMNNILNKLQGDDKYQYIENSENNKTYVPLIIQKTTME